MADTRREPRWSVAFLVVVGMLANACSSSGGGRLRRSSDDGGVVASGGATCAAAQCAGGGNSGGAANAGGSANLGGSVNGGSGGAAAAGGATSGGGAAGAQGGVSAADHCDYQLTGNPNSGYGCLTGEASGIIVYYTCTGARCFGEGNVIWNAPPGSPAVSECMFDHGTGELSFFSEGFVTGEVPTGVINELRLRDMTGEARPVEPACLNPDQGLPVLGVEGTMYFSVPVTCDGNMDRLVPLGFEGPGFWLCGECNYEDGMQSLAHIGGKFAFSIGGFADITIDEPEPVTCEITGEFDAGGCVDYGATCPPAP